MTAGVAGRPLRVLTYGYFGLGNIGNEASLESFLRRLRAGNPDAEVRCLGVDPAAVERQHGIPARRLMVGRSGRRSRVLRALYRLADVPRTFLLVRGADVVVVPGTGVFESSLADAPFGLPFWMYLLVLSLDLRGLPLVILCVGAESPRHRVTAHFYRRITRRATYCSTRDEESARQVRRLSGAETAVPVFADLAFDLPAPSQPQRDPGRVVVGVMTFGDDPADVEIYRERLTRVVAGLLLSGSSVRIVVGALADFSMADEVADRARAVTTATEEELSVSRASTQSELMCEMAGADAVVASRYHNVVGALRVGVPTVSLGYAGKNLALLRRFGAEAYDQPIDDFDPELVLRHVHDMRSRGRESLKPNALPEVQRALDEQYRGLTDLLGLRGA